MKNRIRRELAVLSAAALTITGMVALAGPASAATTIHCGDTIDHSIVVANDLTNCTSNGLIITASNITVDLNNHTIDGDTSQLGFASPEIAGIRLRSVHDVTVKNGTVRQFEAGIFVKGGSANTLTGLRVLDNINALRGPRENGREGACTLGDGITTLDSSQNLITENQVAHNGPFSGVSLVGNSDANKVTRNQVANNNISNVRPNGTTGPCGAPFSRPHQDIGIRVEGPGADNNVVANNSVVNNQLDGISIHGYVCHPPVGDPEPNNGNNVIRGNTVQHNGWASPSETQDGIGILSQGPSTVVCVSFHNTIVANTVTDSGQHGIFVGGRGSHDNTINDNIVDQNGFGCTGPIIDPQFGPSCLPGDGIHVTGPSPTATCGPDLVNPCPGAVDNTLHDNEGHGNARYDGFDGNPNCDNNDWARNLFGTVNQPCVAANGGTGVVPS